MLKIGDGDRAKDPGIQEPVALRVGHLSNRGQLILLPGGASRTSPEERARDMPSAGHLDLHLRVARLFSEQDSSMRDARFGSDAPQCERVNIPRSDVMGAHDSDFRYFQWLLEDCAELERHERAPA